MLKKFVLIVIMAVFSALLLCCNKDKIKTEKAAETTISEYQGMTIIEPVGMTNVFSSNRVKFSNRYNFYDTNASNDIVFIMDGRIYISAKMGVDKESGYFYEKALQSYDLNGCNEEYIIFAPVIENSAIEFLWYDSDYNVISIEQSEYEYTLYKKSPSNEILFSIPLNVKDPIISMVIGENNNIYFGTENTVIVYSSDGELIHKQSLSYTLAYISSAHGKKPILKMYDKNNFVKYQYINVDMKKLENIEMPVKSIYYGYSNIIYGEGYDYYHVTITGVYGYDIKNNTLTKTLDWINSDIQYTLGTVFIFSILSADKMYMIQFDYTVMETMFTVLDRMNEKDIPEKVYLSIGYISPFSAQYLESVVSLFNKDNNKYRITLKNYYSPYDELDPMLRLNNDIASGNSPDMIYMNEYISLLSYSKNGMFVDLSEYLTDDKELYNNLLPLASESAKINGKLYQMITNFTITTLMGKTKNIGEKDRWSFRDAINMYKKSLANGNISSVFNKLYFKEIIMPEIISEYIDYEKGVCDFNKQGFGDFLELMKMLPDNMDVREVAEYNNFMHYLYSKSRNDESLIELVGPIMGVSTFMQEKAYFFRDDDVNIIGFPSGEGAEHKDVIKANGFSIINSSEHKDAAWELIKYCLSDKFADVGVFENSAIIPTNTGIDIINKRYKDKDMYLYITDNFRNILLSKVDENDEKQMEQRHGTGIYVHLDEKVMDEFKKYVNELGAYVQKDTNIINIINEEIDEYLNTNKSTDDTIKEWTKRYI